MHRQPTVTKPARTRHLASNPADHVTVGPGAPGVRLRKEEGHDLYVFCRHHPPQLRDRHLGPAERSAGPAPLRRARRGPARRGDHRTRGQAPPQRARLFRPDRAAPARRPADRVRSAGRAGPGQRPGRHGARRAEPHRPRGAAGRVPAGRQRLAHPRGRAQLRRRGPRRHPGLEGPADAGQGVGGRTGGRGVPCGAGRRVRSGPGWPRSRSAAPTSICSTSRARSTCTRSASSRATPVSCC